MKLFGYEIKRPEKQQTKLFDELWKIHEKWRKSYHISSSYADHVLIANIEEFIEKKVVPAEQKEDK